MQQAANRYEQPPVTAGSTNRRVCPLCGGTEHSQWRRMNLLRCTYCGLVFDGRVWEEGSDREVEAEWFDEGTPSEITGWVRTFEHLNNRRTWRRIASLVPPAGTLLEIGVGSGSFLAYVRSKGMAAEGCDLSRTVCEAVTKRTGIPVFHGDIAQAPKRKTFDVVVMNHVLEHVCSPSKFLEDVRPRLRRGGLLHVAVPNILCWEASLPGWSGYEPYHFTYFSRKTLGRAVEGAGLSVLRVETHESFSGWFLTGLRSLIGCHTRRAESMKGLRRKRDNTWLEHCYRSAMALAGAVTLPVRALQSAIGRGDELVLLCRSTASST